MRSSPDLPSRQVLTPRPLGDVADHPSPVAATVEESLPERELEDRLRRRLFVLGHSAVRQGLMTVAVFTAVFAGLTGPRHAIFIWAALMLCVLLVRLHFLDQNLRVYPAPEYVERQPAGNWRYFGPYTATSAAWSLGPWFLVPLGPIPTEWLALLAVFMSGLMTGPVPVIVPSRTAAHVWLLPLALGMAARAAVHGGMVGWTLCTYILVYATVALRFALQQNDLLRAGLHSQIEKEALSRQLMAQSQDLERLNTERSRFFAAASHDLRQPVHALALFSEALRREVLGTPTQPLAERVVEATQSVSGLLNGLLDISKIDAGAVQPVFAPVAVDQIFLRLSQLYEDRAAAARLQLRFHPIPFEIVSDADLLLRVLFNFVDNAFKYCERGGVLVSARLRGGRIRFAVWDTGRGIGAEHLSRVFDEFYQVDNLHRDSARGLGIGLAIVRRLAVLLEGQVGLRSTPGRGSVFWIELPLRAGAAPQATVAADGAAAPAPWVGSTSAEAPERPLQVLVLDDEAAVCEAMRLWLAPYCAAIHTAQTVEEAGLVVAREGARLDALLVDYRLPGELDGIGAAHRLRALAGKTLPVILITGDTDPVLVRAAYDSGLLVMFKPVQPEQLATQLRELCAASARTGIPTHDNSRLSR
ncbi:hybrid sensor histidine kinase/response regulator [Variovorax sp. Sphag1AA]|uniref:hybrid sensor histidine kinase/response regulator n=1 Tax=Variovorax sp. Sphag1AA TaxID=2587027 RepID=UPI001619D1AF|nr:hybrid sensor histidine kinase/response regulator [Variovorax sp. Sphag1AA]MBB3181781.1 signal transduction histidine kinase [Variovorax sp. Sphag1AA]